MDDVIQHTKHVHD